jgi:SAM-dependent methyltransferase
VSAATDRTCLTQDAYADSGSLQTRRNIYDYLREPWDITAWMASHADVQAGDRVLDVGCGPAYNLVHVLRTVPNVDAFPSDLSPGMAREANTAVGRTTTTVADAQALPYADRAADVVLATHMLYHVPDIAAAARELARVARRRVVITTNCGDHTDEIFDLLLVCARDVGGPAYEAPPRAFNRFLFEDAPRLLGEALVVESAADAGGVIEVPSVEPVVDYLDTLRSLYGSTLPEPQWPALLDAARVRVAAEIAERGVWTTHNHVGLLVLRRAA